MHIIMHMNWNGVVVDIKYLYNAIAIIRNNSLASVMHVLPKHVFI